MTSDPEPARYATIFAMIAEPATGTLHLASGQPCEHLFETLSVPAILEGARSSV